MRHRNVTQTFEIQQTFRSVGVFAAREENITHIVHLADYTMVNAGVQRWHQAPLVFKRTVSEQTSSLLNTMVFKDGHSHVND
jgi:hypothetical protein